MTTLSNVKKLSVIAAGATCLSLGAMNPAQALNLVTNGGFETGNFSGWTQSGNTGATGVNTFSANSGTYGAFFGPVGSQGFLSQTLATVVGQTYNLSYFLKNDGGQPNFFSVSVGSEELSSFKNLSFAFPFVSNSFNFVATAPSTVLKFAFQHNPAYLRLDDVSVTSTATAIPTPALLPGLVGLGLGVLRKRKAAATAVEA